MPIRHVFLDMDGVLVDFHHGFQELCGIKEPIRGHHWPADKGLHDHVGMDWESCRQKSREAPPSFWANMNETPYGLKIALACEEFAKRIGAHFSVLTDSSDSRDAGLGKLQWLHERIPILAPRCCLTVDKTGFANPDCLLVDDTHHVAENFNKAGGRAIVIPQTWNQWKLAYGAPRSPLIGGLLELAAQYDDPEFFVYDKKSHRMYDRG